MTSTDRDLLPRLQAGEATARQELFQHCQQRLSPYFRKRLANPSEVEDCVSEVLTRALEGIGKGHQPQVLDAWIFGIAHNVAKEHYKDVRRRDGKEIPVDLPGEPQVPNLKLEQPRQPDKDLPELPEDWEFLHGKRELWAMLRAAIDGTHPGLQTIMRAHLEHSLNKDRPVIGAELADTWAMPVEQMNRQLNRAREATRDALVALVLARTGRDNCSELAHKLDQILSIDQ